MNQMRGNRKHRSIIRPAVLLIMLQIGSLLISSCYGCLESERTALLRVKDSLNHPNGSALPSWGKQANCCQWDGVDCHATTSRVLRLSLNYVRDTRLPPWHLNCSLFLPFQDLQELYLLGNSIAGCVENEGFNRLSTLQNLRVLDLSRNRFVDHTAILSLKGIPSLTSLGLDAFWDPDQEVDYRSFEILRKLKDLEFLDLSYNYMDNRILSYLVSLSTLKTLHLDGNNLQETIHIQGDHGHELLKLSNLEVLDLGTNNLSSNVFSSLSGLLSLKILYLDENALGGTFVTAELNPLHNLEELYLMGTYIEQFTAAKETTTLSKLKLLDISSNNRRVDLLQLNKAFQLVKSFKLQYNQIEHATAIEGFKNLEELYLDGSVLDENFLPSVGVSNSIKVLSLKGCNLNGSFPSKGWCELNTLQQLNLGGNNLHGNLPSCLRNLTSLGALDISDNIFTGDIHY